MEELYVLKQHGSLSLFEAEKMTGEERAWWVKRLQKDAEKQQKNNSSEPKQLPPGLQ